MVRTSTALGLLALSAALVAGQDKPAAADADQEKLQGVWHSPADAKKQLKIIFMDDKVGFTTSDPGAKPPASTSSFVALSPAKFAEAGGKRSFEITVAKDYTRKADYRFEKDSLVVGVDGAEYKVERAHTRASANPAAKKLLGKWTVTGVEAKGMKATAKDAGLEVIEFTEDRYVWKAPGGKEVLNSFYRLGDGKGAAELDVYGMKSEVTIPALIELTGDELVLAQPLKPGVAGAARPKGFDSKDADVFVVRAKRDK